MPVRASDIQKIRSFRKSRPRTSELEEKLSKERKSREIIIVPGQNEAALRSERTQISKRESAMPCWGGGGKGKRGPAQPPPQNVGRRWPTNRPGSKEKSTMSDRRRFVHYVLRAMTKPRPGSVNEGKQKTWQSKILRGVRDGRHGES